MTDEDDPLHGADIGETRRISVTDESWLVNSEPGEFYGSDREGRVDDVSAEVIIEDDGSRKLLLTYEGEVTKKLGPYWNDAREPLTEEEERTQRARARKKKWINRIAGTISILLPLGVLFVIANWVMGNLAGEVTINGEPMGTPNPIVMAGVFGIILAIAWLSSRYATGASFGAWSA